MNSSIDRRQFAKYFFNLAGAVFGFAALNSCAQKKKETKDKPADCNDLSGLTEDEMTSRKKLGYREKSPSEERRCAKCALFLPNPNDGSCGRCTLVKGPVNAAGTCVYWVSKTEG